MLEEILLNSNQSGFRLGDCFINQLLAITHEIFEAIDSLIYQKLLARFGMKACFIRLSPWVYQENFAVFLKAIFQVDSKRVVLNGQPVLTGVPQGSILGPLLFLIYINDSPNELKSNLKLFADDASLFTIVKDKNESPNTLNNDLMLISKWAYNWKMFFNPDPSKSAQEV